MRIGIIGAMEEEIHHMKELFDLYGESHYARIAFYEGTFAGKEVILCRSGVGKVNAAITTQLLVDRFNVTHVLFTGVAGALNPELEIGNIVISTSALQHDMDATALSEEYPQGTIPMFPYTSDFPADPNLIMLAEQAAATLSGIRVIKGRVLSGDQFIASKETVAAYFKKFDGACIEMEGAAVAQVCFLNEVPFVIVRSISDKANSKANMDFAQFIRLAAERSSRIVEKMLRQL